MRSQYIWKNRGEAVTVNLSRKGQNRQLYGLFLAGGKKAHSTRSTSSGQAGSGQEFTIDINVKHLAPDTESLIVLRGLVADRAAVNVHGKVFIKKGAKGAKTHFEAKALLLSKEARCEIIPALEIDENEVKASHSTYVGKLDEEDLFYLQSRGIAQKEAKRLLIGAFLYPVISQMQISKLSIKI